MILVRPYELLSMIRSFYPIVPRSIKKSRYAALGVLRLLSVCSKRFLTNKAAG